VALIRASLDPLIDSGVLDDPSPADQRSLQLTFFDRTPDRPVLTSCQLRNFLHGQIWTGHFRLLPAQTRGPPRLVERQKGQMCKGPLNVSRWPDRTGSGLLVKATPEE
jgi:hypothetical protein